MLPCVGEGAQLHVNAAFGRYRLLERLGQGGMAEVFKAKSYGVEGFEKVLVIKRILPDLARSQEFVDMFIHEAKLSVRLSHANIVQVFDLGIAPVGDAVGSKNADAYYIAMEYVHGMDLATLLAKCRRAQVVLPIDMCVFIAAEIAKGLDHAHRRRDEQLQPLGIVHRDVSPQNVLVSYEGEVKVTDFGIAKARGVLDAKPIADGASARKLHGKFAYMSPEQSRGESVDARSDLFSLGTILYECVAGVNPFSAPTTIETLRRVQAGEFPPVELLRPDVPSELIAILNTAMAKDPADRYSDAGRMYEAMLAFLYAHGSRFGAHDLAEFLSRFRDEETGLHSAVTPLLDGAPTNRTPMDSPPARTVSVSRFESGMRFVGFDRAAEMGERREVTALVLELPRGSPSVGDKATEVIERYGGRVIKREPEQIAALFGLGEPDGRDTEAATRCALVALRGREGPRSASAGVHTGRIHVSHTGDPTQDDRLGTLVGTARELARVREGWCAMSTAAMRQVKPLFEFEALSENDHSLLSVTGVLVKDVRGPAEAFGRFVGRKEELRTIGEVLAAATKRVASALTIRGDHGIGKTRLLFEVDRRLRKGAYNVGFHVATCPPRGFQFPLSGIVCMLQVLCGVTDGDAPERILAVQPRLRALGLTEEEVSAVLAALGAGGQRSGMGNAKSTLRNAFARMVASLCEDRPHTFAWDAAHCMDEDSFALLDDVFRKLSTSRVVFVFAARAGFSHPLEKAPGHASLDLKDLPSQDVARLVALRLGVDRAPEELLRFVRERAGGHPLFVEEVLKALVDAGAVTVTDKRVSAMKLVGQELALPKTLRGLVASRVARLSSEDRTTLQAAAVLGDPIDAAVLARMLDQPLATLDKSLAVLKARDFLVHSGPSELRFTSPIVPEVVEDALPPEVGREMHLAAGQALEAVLGDRAWEQAARIATHLYEAGDRERAASYFAKSGERRATARQLEAAARDYARAIALCDPAAREPSELASWLAGLASAVRLVRLAPEASELCERVLARLDEAGSTELRIRARVNAGHVLGAVHRFEKAWQYFHEAERIARGHEALTKSVLAASADQASRQGDFRRSQALLERLEELVSDDGNAHEQHKILLNLAQARAALGDRGAALAALERAERLLPDDPTAVVERQKLRGFVEYFSRDFRAAATEFQRAVESARALGLTFEVMANLHNLGDVLVRLDDLAHAYGTIQQSLALCDECGYERPGSVNRMFLAYLDGVAGAADGEAQLRQGVAYAEANEFTWDVIVGRTLLAQLLSRRGDIERARVEFERVKALAQANGQLMVVDECEQALRTLGEAP